MAYHEVKNSATRLHDEKFIGHPFEGYYIGSRTFDGKFGEGVIHEFRKLKNGEPISFYGFTALNSKIEQIRPGQLCRITYTGMQNVKTKYGMKDTHTCVVEIDDQKVFSGQLAADPEPKKNKGNGKKVETDEPVDVDLPF